MKWGKGSHARQYSPVYWWALSFTGHLAAKCPCAPQCMQRPLSMRRWGSAAEMRRPPSCMGSGTGEATMGEQTMGGIARSLGMELWPWWRKKSACRGEWPALPVGPNRLADHEIESPPWSPQREKPYKKIEWGEGETPFAGSMLWPDYYVTTQTDAEAKASQNENVLSTKRTQAVCCSLARSDIRRTGK